MKTILLLFVISSFVIRHSLAADARVITEGGTNILAIGIDSRDYDVVRFYFRGADGKVTNQFEIRPDDLIQRDRSVLPPVLRGGSQLLTAPETTKLITFNKPMPDASYIVLLTPRAPTGVSFSNPTTNGFTLNLTAGIAGRVDWLAINPQ
jgi:hypothetical protein